MKRPTGQHSQIPNTLGGSWDDMASMEPALVTTGKSGEQGMWERLLHTPDSFYAQRKSEDPWKPL